MLSRLRHLLYPLVRHILFQMPPETAHYVSLESLKLLNNLGLNKGLVGAALTGTAAMDTALACPVKVMGIEFPNPVGLSAGMDKNGDYILPLARLGFGHLELGTVTPRAQFGNPKPRMYRITQEEALINRLGFNSKGVEHVVQQVRKARDEGFQGVLGINISKNFDTSIEHAIDDYLICFNQVYPWADYITINVSSPNTPGLRALQGLEQMAALIRALKNQQQRLQSQLQKYVPIAIKIAPDLDKQQIDDLAETFITHQVDAVIATNTTLARDGVESYSSSRQDGGLSGKPLMPHATEVLKLFHQKMGDKVPLIGVGGILSGTDALAKITAGAKLVQLYTGFVYRGPGLIQECVRSISQAQL